jgi:hypothetical protein
MQPRAQRVTTSIPVLYRHPGDHSWLESRAVNLSESGILFGPAEVQSGSFVEVMLSPPERIGPLTTGPQIYSGEVVRVDDRGTVAVRFEESWFVLDA